MKQWIGGLVLGLMLGLCVVAFAQAPQAATTTNAVAAPPAAGTLDDSDKLLIQVVSLQAQLAQCQADQLDSMKNFTSTRAAVVKQIEGKHPGFTLDLSTGKLVPKK